MKKIIFLLLVALTFVPYIESVILTKDGKIEVVTVYPSSHVYSGGGQAVGEAIKRIYMASGDKIVLEKEIKGYCYPATTETIPSRIEWK